MRYFFSLCLLWRMLQINAASKEDYSCYIIKEQKLFPHHFASFLKLMIHSWIFIWEHLRISLNMFDHIERQILKYLSLFCQVSMSVSWLYFRYHYSFFCAHIYLNINLWWHHMSPHLYVCIYIYLYLNLCLCSYFHFIDIHLNIYILYRNISKHESAMASHWVLGSPNLYIFIYLDFSSTFIFITCLSKL